MNHYAFADKCSRTARDAYDPVLQRVTCAAGYANDPLIKDAANCELVPIDGTVYFWTHATPYGNGSYSPSDYVVYNNLVSSFQSHCEQWQIILA